jgi:ribonucleoside-diphosphate reductase beta chain
VGVAGYAHFLALAQRVQWDADAIDLTADAAAWTDEWLTPIAGFCLAEEAVAEEIAPFASAAMAGGGEGAVAAPTDGAGIADAGACFAAQQRDERRHARFFARVATEVVGATPEQLCAHADPRWRDLFEHELPAAARALAEAPEGLPQAVGLYHMVLEGVVLTTGLHELIAAPLPGISAGAQLILRDERWHVGFGARCLQDAGLDPRTEAGIVRTGERAGAAGPALDTLRRRLAVVR